MNIIEKVVKEIYHWYYPEDWKWEDIMAGDLEAKYISLARQLLSLETEDTRLAIVYKDSEEHLPISESDMAKQFPCIFDGNLSMTQYINSKSQYLSWIKPLVEDMLAQGWVKEALDE